MINEKNVSKLAATYYNSIFSSRKIAAKFDHILQTSSQKNDPATNLKEHNAHLMRTYDERVKARHRKNLTVDNISKKTKEAHLLPQIARISPNFLDFDNHTFDETPEIYPRKGSIVIESQDLEGNVFGSPIKKGFSKKTHQFKIKNITEFKPDKSKLLITTERQSQPQIPQKKKVIKKLFPHHIKTKKNFQSPMFLSKVPRMFDISPDPIKNPPKATVVNKSIDFTQKTSKRPLSVEPLPIGVKRNSLESLTVNSSLDDIPKNEFEDSDIPSFNKSTAYGFRRKFIKGRPKHSPSPQTNILFGDARNPFSDLDMSQLISSQRSTQRAWPALQDYKRNPGSVPISASDQKSIYAKGNSFSFDNQIEFLKIKQHKKPVENRQFSITVYNKSPRDLKPNIEKIRYISEKVSL